ncbi:MAG: glutathione S-transferase family protein [Candidatus Binatia bacterium]
MNPFAPPSGFRAVSPLGRIPAFRHDDKVVNDSSVICRYVERLHPTPAFYPSDPYQSARAEWIEEFMDGGFVPVAGPKVFFPLVLGPLMTGKEADETEPRKVIEEELPRFYDYLEAQLGDGEYFVGASMSIADLSVASMFVNLRLAGEAPDARRWPRLRSFLKRMRAPQPAGGHPADHFRSSVGAGKELA